MSSETSETPGSDGPLEADDTETDGYVHEPDRSDADKTASTGPYTGKPEGEGFGKQGWVLVAAVVVCFLVIPGVIDLNPTAPAQLGWTFFATFLVLPLIPALLLGLIAVWSMQAAS